MSRLGVLALVALGLGMLTGAVVLVGSGVGGNDVAPRGRPAGGRANPTTEAMGYVAADAPFLAVVATDPIRGPLATLARLPGAAQATQQAKSALGDALGLVGGGALSALLGNDLVISASGPSAAGALAAIVARDASALDDLVARSSEAGGLVSAGTYRGAKLYSRPGGGADAVSGPVFLAGPDAPAVRRALDRHAGSGGPALTPGRFRALTRGVDARGALVRARFDARAAVVSLGALLRSRSPSGALGLVGRALSGTRGGGAPWVFALRGGALAVVPTTGGLRVRAHLATVAADLSDADVPLATGSPAPVPRGDGTVVAGIRDAAHTLMFLERAIGQVDPATLKTYTQLKATLARFGGVDIERSVIAAMTGSTTISVTDLGVSLSAELSDPSTVAAAMQRISGLSDLAPLAGLAGIDLQGFSLADDANGTYELERDGTTLALMGVRGRSLIVSTDPGADLDTIAAAPPVGPGSPPSKGALRAILDSPALGHGIAQSLVLPSIADTVVAALGEGTLTARAETDGLDAELTLPTGG